VDELRFGGARAENGGVRVRLLWVPLAVATLALSVAGSPQPSAKAHAAHPAEMRVDINHASIEELLKIPGMKRTWASRIVPSRPDRAKNELLDRGVVPSQIYNHIKDYVIAHRDKQQTAIN
jgi:competence protein ComEA